MAKWKGSFQLIEGDKWEGQLKRARASKAERLNSLKRQDALPAFIRKYLLFPGRDLLQELI